MKRSCKLVFTCNLFHRDTFWTTGHTFPPRREACCRVQYYPGQHGQNFYVRLFKKEAARKQYVTNWNKKECSNLSELVWKSNRLLHVLEINCIVRYLTTGLNSTKFLPLRKVFAPRKKDFWKREQILVSSWNFSILKKRHNSVFEDNKRNGNVNLCKWNGNKMHRKMSLYLLTYLMLFDHGLRSVWISRCNWWRYSNLKSQRKRGFSLISKGW